jgi:type I restriction enzyme S subunit
VSGLPPGWAIATLRQLCERIVDGSHNPPRAVSEGHPMLSARNVQNRHINFDQFRFITESDFAVEHSRTGVSPGDVLLTIVGTIGRTAVVPEGIVPFALQRSVAVMKPNSAVRPHYLAYMLEAPPVQQFLRNNAKGTAQKGIYLTALSSVELPLAPVNEQQLIAEKLDAMLARVGACRERLDRVPQILKKFREGVLEAAVSGRLTEEWRGRLDGTATANWTDLKLAEACEADRIVTYGVIKLGADVARGVPCLRTSNVRWLRIDEGGIKRIAPKLSAEYARTVLRGDEVLVNVRGTLGGVATVSPHMVGWNVSREVAVVPVATSVLRPKFLALWIAANRTQRWLTGVQKGVAYTGINIEDLRELPVRLPPEDEQIEIIRQVEELFALADGMERRYQEALANVDKLTPAVLAKAFRGELVPQDPNDEPAEKLLARIRSAAVASGTGSLHVRNSKRSARRSSGHLKRGSAAGEVP